MTVINIKDLMKISIKDISHQNKNIFSPEVLITHIRHKNVKYIYKKSHKYHGTIKVKKTEMHFI